MMKPAWYYRPSSCHISTATFVLFIFFIIPCASALGKKVVFAINAGGESHTDIYGIKYLKGDEACSDPHTQQHL